MISDRQALALGFIRMNLGFVRGWGQLLAHWTIFLPEAWERPDV
jgi:hypothetical protein